MGYAVFQRRVISPLTGSGEGAAPGSGATITLFDSGDNDTSGTRGARYKRIVTFVYSSHVSATNGLKFEVTYNGGANWRELVYYTVSATTSTLRFVAVAAPRWRVTYENSADVLTAWESLVMADTEERATT